MMSSPNAPIPNAQAPIQVAHNPLCQPIPASNSELQTQWKDFFARQSTRTRVTEGSRPIQLSVENQRTNSPWGDLLNEKSDHVTRVYSLNVNGFALDRRGGQFDELCRIASEVQTDMIACQEINIDTTQPVVRSILYETLRKAWTRSRLALGCTDTTFVNMYKPGGTMLVLKDNITGRVLSSTSDKWGRWTSQRLRCQHERKLTVISAYQVGPEASSPGKTTAATQQRSFLIQSQDPLTDPRSAFVRDLRLYLQSCLTQGDDLMLVGDFNEVIGQDPTPLTAMFSEFGLINLMTVRHSDPPPATYARGRKCIDYGFGTPRVANALEACGYEAFNARFATDHRSYFFDFNTAQLFGTSTPTLATPALRTLQSKNVKQITSYIKLVYDYLMQCNAFERAKRLCHPGNRHAYAERLDKDMIQACLMAEKKIKRYGEPAWSIALDQVRKKAVLLRKCLSTIRTGLNLTDIIQESNRNLITPIELPRTKQECCDHLRLVKREIEDIVNASVKHREDEIKQRITSLEVSGKKSDAATAIILRRLQRAEEIKRLFSKLRSVRTKNERRGVTAIEIPVHPDVDPKTCTEWQTIDVPTEIVEHLQARNKIHFGQAHGTPFTIPPLSHDLGFCGDQPGAEDILRGRYDTTPFAESVRLLLQHLHITQEVASDNSYPTITDAEFVGKLKVWKESTATSPSGLHLGHYKALIARHEYSEDEEASGEPESITTQVPTSKRAEWDHMQRALRIFHLDLINYALERGYSFQRWQTIANTILFKDKDNVQLHRTRVIHIYEADYNLVLGLKWRMALYQAEALKILNEGHYGSRPKRNAIDPVMLEELQLEISRMSRRMLIHTNYDATSCYDRIIPNLAMLASQKYGVHPKVTQMNAMTLQKAKYHVRTELGLSDTSFSHSDLSPIYGTGQGSGNASILWLFLCCILFDIYDKMSTPARYTHPDRSHETKVSLIGFVDDNNGQANKFKAIQSWTNLQRLLRQAQRNANLWALLLCATGGALELAKCSYHILFWKFSIQGAPVLTHLKNDVPPMEVTDPHTNTTCELEYLNPYSAHKTLGCYKEPAGTQVTQFKKLKEKSDSITSFLWSTPLTRGEAWTYYTACYLPSVCYPLTASHLTPKQLGKIQQKAMMIIIPRCGFNRNTHRSIIYGPYQLGGATFRNLAVEQGVLQVAYFLRQWRTNSLVGELLRCSVAWLQASVGTSYSVFRQPQTPLPHLESKWLASLLSFLALHGLSIHLDDTYIPPPQRQHDEYIMDRLMSSNHYTPAELRKLNYCRLFLNVTTISDLTKPCGTVLDTSFLDGTPSPQSSRNTQLAIHQESPSANEWKLWRRANLIWSDIHGKLRQPLGSWTQQLHKQRCRHQAYQQAQLLWIRQQDQDTYREYRAPPSAQTYTATFHIVEFDMIPAQAHPVEIQELNIPDHWRIVTPGQVIIPLPVPRPMADMTFSEYIQSLDAWETELLHDVEMDGDPFEFCVDLQPYQRAVSDGSVRHHNQGAFGWTIRNEQGQRVAAGMGPASGSRPTSYRAEAYGMLSLLRFLIRIREYTSMNFQWIGVIATDSQSLLDTLNGVDEVNNSNDDLPMSSTDGNIVLDVLIPDWDVLVEIQRSLDQLPQIKLDYVKGHQDRTTPYAQLDQMAQLNVDADAKAGQYQDEFGAVRPIAQLMPHTGAHLVGPEGTITAHYQNFMRYQASATPLQTYLMSKYNWSQHVFDVINWDAHGAALKKVTKRRIHYIKMIFDILPTNSQANRYDKGTRTCPTCANEQETRDHILRCNHPEAQTWRDNLKIELTDFYRRTMTEPELARLMTLALDQWFADDAQDIQVDPIPFSDALRNLIIEQNAIGWRQIFSGRFSKEWSIVQQTQYNRLPRREGQRKRTGNQWQSQLIMVLWESWYKRWTTRNKAEHGHTVDTRQRAIRREVNRQLDQIYQHRHMMEPRVQELLFDSPEDHQHQQLHITRNWLAQHSTVFKESIRRVRKRAIQGVRSIRTYFQPSSSGGG